MKKILLALLFFGCGTVHAATTKISYAAAVTMTGSGINSLSASAPSTTQSCYQMAPVDNTANLYVDAFVVATASMSASSLGSNKQVTYWLASSDGTDPYTQDDAAISGSAGSYTINIPSNLKQVSTMPVLTSNKQYVTGFSVANANGGVMPAKWAIIVCNDTNQTTAAAGNSVFYTGIYYTSN